MADPIVTIDSDDEGSSSGGGGGGSKEPQGATAQHDASQSTEREQMECPICLQTCIHPARLPCGHIFCFLCVKGVAYKNRRCAMCRRDIPVEFLDHPELVYKIQDAGPTTDDGYQWFYEGRNGWWQYDERTSQEIEEAKCRGDKFCTILVAGYVYVVDFETMLQQRQNDPSRKRQVKRDLASTPKKGVAGLRIDGTVEPLVSVAASTSSVVNTPEASGSSSSSNSTMQSTIAATDAAIRIASDIIDSTLAHADEYRDMDSSSALSTSSSSSSSSSSAATAEYTELDGGAGDHQSRHELLHEVEDVLNVSAVVTTSASTTVSNGLAFFSSTIDGFRSMALSNIAESSSDEDNEDDENGSGSHQMGGKESDLSPFVRNTK